jgi:hypothetical protein
MVGFLQQASEDEPKEVKTEQFRNQASLNFVSLRTLLHDIGRFGLSRVEMKALRAPAADALIFRYPDLALGLVFLQSFCKVNGKP